MGLFSKFNKKGKQKEKPAEKRSESILAPSDESSVEAKFEQLKPHIYPYLRPANTPSYIRFDAAGKNIDIPLPSVPFHAATKIFFVEDTGSSFRVVQQSAVPQSVGALGLLNIAVQNLVKNVKFEVRATKFGGYAFVGNPNHISSFILIKSLWKELAKRVNDNLIIAIPVREAMIFIPEKKKDELLPQLATACVALMKDPEHRTHPLTPLLFFFNKDTDRLTTYTAPKKPDGPQLHVMPKSEPTVPESEVPAEPLKEEMPKAAAPQLHLVPDVEPEKAAKESKVEEAKPEESKPEE